MAVVPARPPRIVNHQARPVYLSRSRDVVVLLPRRHELGYPLPGSNGAVVGTDPTPADPTAYGVGVYGKGEYGQ